MAVERWHQVAFLDECGPGMTPVAIGNRRLLVVRSGATLRVVDADCPHRGAHLAQGRLIDDVIVCPFHGYRIGLPGAAAAQCEHGFFVQGHPVLAAAGALFTGLAGRPDNGLAQALEVMAAQFRVAGRLVFEVDADPTLVAENGFDAAHFAKLHDIQRVVEFSASKEANGSLAASAEFEISMLDRGRPDQPRCVHRVPYRCTAYAPGIVLSSVGGESPYAVLTAATPNAAGRTTVRVTLGLPPGNGDPQALLGYFRDGLEKDRAIWDSIDPRTQPRFVPADAAVLAFRSFCAEFDGEGNTP